MELDCGGKCATLVELTCSRNKEELKETTLCGRISEKRKLKDKEKDELCAEKMNLNLKLKKLKKLRGNRRVSVLREMKWEHDNGASDRLFF